MKNILKIALFWIYLMVSYTAHAQLTWQRVVGSPANEYLLDLILTNDSNYAFTGSIDELDSIRLLLCKMDQNGNIIWNKTYLANSYSFGKSLIQTNDGGYLIAGDTYVALNGIMLMRTNNMGDTLWTRTIQDTIGLTSRTIFQKNNGSYILSGNLLTSTGFCLIEMDTAGNIVWSKKYLTNGVTTFQTLETTNGALLVVGEDLGTMDSMRTICLQMDSYGNLLQNKTIQLIGFETMLVQSVSNTIDSGLIVAGIDYSRTSPFKIILTKLNNNLDILWTKVISDSTGEYLPTNAYIKQCVDSGFIITGAVKGNFPDSMSIYLLKTDELGNVLWSRIIGALDSPRGEASYQVIQNIDGGYLVGGYTDFLGASTIGVRDIYLVKTDGEGNSSCWNYPGHFVSQAGNVLIDSIPIQVDTGVVCIQQSVSIRTPVLRDDTLCFTNSVQEVNDNFPKLYCHPNPVRDFTFISFPNPSNLKCSLTLYDMTGRVRRKMLRVENTLTRFEKGDLEAGLYIFEINSETKVMGVGKLLIE